MRRGEVNRSLHSEYYHPERRLAIKAIKTKWKNQSSSLGKVINFDERLSQFQPNLFYVGLANIESETGTFAETDEQEPEGTTRLFNQGDVLYGKLRPYLNKVYIAKNDGQASTEIYALSAIEPEKLDHSFLSAFLMSKPFLSQTIHMMTGNTHPRIQREDFEEIVIPLPDIDTQRTLVADMESARLARQEKLSQADELLKGIDGFVLEQLEIKLPKEEKKKIFAVHFSEIKKRNDPDYHSPYFRAVRSAIQKSKFKVSRLGKVLQKPFASGFAAGRNDQAEDEQEGVPHVRPFNISPNGEFRLETIKYVPRENVAENDWLTKGEVLFNNTNSTEWVGKTAVFDSDEPCACSNHITRLFLDREETEPLFIASQLNAFRSLGLFGLLSTNFNNQAGINSETLSELEVLLPPLETQKKIAAELNHRRAQARALREETEREWQNAKENFEKALLG